MRILVVGAGGTGGYFGGLLARAGEDVTFLARGAHLAALRAHGLTVRSRLAGDFTLPVTATDDLAAVGPVDLVLFCVKMYDIPSASAGLGTVVGPETVVLPIQNGIDAAEMLSQAVGAEHVLGAAAYVTSQIAAPGVIVQSAGPGTLDLGELTGGQSDRPRQLAPTFQTAGIATGLPPDIRVTLWEKFIFICAFSGVTALTRLTIGQALAHPATLDLFTEVLREGEAVARAQGVALPAEIVERLMARMRGTGATARGSMAVDLLAGHRLEIDALNGTMARLGHAQTVPTPLNFAIYAALAPYAEGAPP